MNSYQKLFLVCDSADQFLKESNDISAQNEIVQFSILGCLLAIEEILDKGRISASVGEFKPEDKKMLNQRMDALRGNIVEFLKKLSGQFGKDKAVEYLQSRVRGMQGAWVNSF